MQCTHLPLNCNLSIDHRLSERLSNQQRVIGSDHPHPEMKDTKEHTKVMSIKFNQLLEA